MLNWHGYQSSVVRAHSVMCCFGAIIIFVRSNACGDRKHHCTTGAFDSTVRTVFQQFELRLVMLMAEGMVDTQETWFKWDLNPVFYMACCNQTVDTYSRNVYHITVRVQFGLFKSVLKTDIIEWKHMEPVHMGFFAWLNCCTNLDCISNDFQQIVEHWFLGGNVCKDANTRLQLLFSSELQWFG